MDVLNNNNCNEWPFSRSGQTVGQGNIIRSAIRILIAVINTADLYRVYEDVVFFFVFFFKYNRFSTRTMNSR